MSRSFFILTVAAVLLQACGDDGPSSPTPTPSAATTTAPASTVLTIVSGETSEPVEGARVLVGGESFVTDESGRAQVGALRPGENLDILAEGFFDRQTLYRSSSEPKLSLWPLASDTGLTQDLTQRLVYTGFGRDAVRGELPLRRPPLGEAIQIFVDPEIAGDPRVTRVVEGSIAAMRAALHDRLAFVVTASAPVRGVVWHVFIDPDAVDSEFIATTELRFENREVVGAELGFRRLDDLVDNERLMTNNMGNAFGLTHSFDVNDRMYYDWWRRRPNDFSPKESLVMRLMLERPAGNRWPDNDRSLGASRFAPETVSYVKAPHP